MSVVNLDEKFEVFYDGECALCTREIKLLRRLDKHHRIQFTDIAAADFDSIKDAGIPFETLMDEIHGRFENGEVVTGVEVFRQLYGRVGLRWAIGMTRLYGVRHALDSGYRIFAKNRLKWTGRCIDDSCKIPDNPAHSTETV